MGGAPSVQAVKPPDPGQQYQSALSAYVRNAPALYSEESTYQPLYNQMQQGIMGSNIQYYSQALANQLPVLQGAMETSQNLALAQAKAQYEQTAPEISQAALAASPALQQLYGYGQAQLGATADPTLQAVMAGVQQELPGQVGSLYNLAAQARGSLQPVNEQLQNLYGQLGTATAQGVGDIRGVAGAAAADTRSPLWQATAANVQQNLGQLDPNTQQLADLARQQLALGGQVSPDQMADAIQAARAGYSARGMLGASGSIAAEVLGRQNIQQQLLGQREQFASGVSGLVQQQLANRQAAAMGMSQADIAATQANQQLAGQLYGAAGQLGQAGLQAQGGLQAQIAANIQNAQQQQAALTQAGIGTYQQGQQQIAGLQGSILDQLYRQQSAGAAALQNVYGAQQAAQSAVLGTQAGAPNFMTNIYGGLANMGTGSPNLFQGSGLLQLTNQSAMAGMNAQAAANQMNAQSKGASQGAMMGAAGAIGGALITGVAIF